jgi:hypothetical protein
VSGLVAARKVATKGEKLVTPLSDPMDTQGRELVPAGPAGTSAADGPAADPNRIGRDLR